jgi:hypothetical protein
MDGDMDRDLFIYLFIYLLADGGNGRLIYGRMDIWIEQSTDLLIDQRLNAQMVGF